MALISSSPGPEYQPHRSNLFLAHHLTIPSSPSSTYRDGEMSPSLDASFASSMSISSDPVASESLTASSGLGVGQQQGRQATVSSSPDLMDCSPAPLQRPTVVAPRPAPPSFDRPSASSSSSSSSSTGQYPFLRNLFHARGTGPTPLATSSLDAVVASSHASLSMPRTTSPDELALPITAPLVIKRPPPPQHFATMPASQSNKLLLHPKHRAQFELAVEDDDDEDAVEEVHAAVVEEQEEEGLMGPPRLPTRTRSALPSDWAKPGLGRPRHTAPSGGLAPPPVPVKRRSEPSVPTYTVAPESSPYRMDVDGASPGSRLSSPVSLRPAQHPRSVSESRASIPFEFPPGSPPRSQVDPSAEPSGSGASDRLADFFADDLSPIPQSRKRFLAHDERELSPTPGSPSPATGPSVGPSSTSASSLLAAAAPVRRPFEKAVSTTSLPHVARRQRSSLGLGLKKRPSLSTFSSLSTVPAQTAVAPVDLSSTFKRHAPALNGKPKTMRRAYSVADAAVPFNLGTGGSVSASSTLSSAATSSSSSSNRASIATQTLFQAPVGRRLGSNMSSASMDLGSSGEKQRATIPVVESGSPITGFRSQEAKGKALPCFGVKEDGLMRISAATLNELQAGHYTERVQRFLIIDCRFDYEFDGGHITDAINLSEMADVEEALLGIDKLPEPSTSEHMPAEGKTVLIFHCEFSAKRAPTTAKHLRNQDRVKNGGHYPNVHYPEVYVLQGGYAEFFRCFPERCIGGYLAMDDPLHDAKRSVNLHNFRNQNQKRQFQRANTFTFGQAQHASAMLQSATSHPDRHSLQAGTRKPLEPTSRNGVVARKRSGGLDETFSFPAIKGGVTPSQSSTGGDMSACQEDDLEADSSFGTASGSSPGGGDSPCPVNKRNATMGRNGMSDKNKMMLGGKAATLGPRTFQRAQTSSILMFHR